MEQKIDSSKPYYFTLSKKLIVEEIMKDLLRGGEEVLHYDVEDKDETDLEGGARSENSIEINKFLKLLKK